MVELQESGTKFCFKLLVTNVMPTNIPIFFQHKMISLTFIKIMIPLLAFASFQRHSYGKEIQGAAYVRFGIIDENENKIFIPGLEQQLSVGIQWNYSDLSCPS